MSKTTTKKSVNANAKKNTKKMSPSDLEKLKTRKELYNSSDILQFNSSVIKAKDSDLPYLSNKQLWLYNYLSKNDIEKKYNYTITSLSNDYRKVIKDDKEKTSKKDGYKFRKSFKTSEVFSIGDIKSVMQYFYVANNRMWEYYRNDKGNYFLHEVEFIANITTLKDRK